MEKKIKPSLKQTAFNSYKALDQNNEREVEKRTRKKDWIVIKCISVFYSLSFESALRCQSIKI